MKQIMKRINKLYLIRLITALAVAGLSVAAFAGFYFINVFDIQLVSLWQRLLVDFSVFAAVLMGLLLIFTLLFGRVYCSTVCPLGLYQELLTLIFRRKKLKVKESGKWFVFAKYLLAAAVFGALCGSSAILVKFIDPYSLFGSAATGVTLGTAAACLLVPLVWFKGRFFCTCICPVGTVLGLISKFAVNKIYIENDKCISCGLCAAKCPSDCINFKDKKVDNEACVKCFKCLSSCGKGALHYGIDKGKTNNPPFNPVRRKLIIGAVAAAVFAGAFKGSAELKNKITAKIKGVILPAGAGNAKEFANCCLNCNLCVQNCPMKILKKADKDFSAVHIDFSDSFCDYNCNECMKACPSGAIKRLSLAEKQKTQIAVAKVNSEMCIGCGLCVMTCPKKAITKTDENISMVHQDMCIGCGACKIACPVSAIEVFTVENQKIV